MKKIFCIMIFTLILCAAVHANELKSELVLDQKGESLNSGEFISITIRVWPIENPKEDEFRKIEGETIFGGLYINEIASMGPSENNAEVFEIKADAMITDSITKDKLFLNYLGHLIPVKFQEIKINLVSKKAKDYYIFNQGIDFEHKIAIALLLFILSLIVLLVVFRHRVLIFFSKKKQIGPEHQFKLLFKEAKKREDYEKIYIEKENWIPLLIAETQAHKDFFTTINQYQYKKSWTNEELIEVETSFEMIRRSFE